MSGRLNQQARRAQLIEAARGVFVACGLARARTKDIAAAAGVSEAMLYRHFRTKAELFEAAVLRPLEQFAEQMATAGQRMPTVHRHERHEMSLALHRELLETMYTMAPLLNSALYDDSASGSRFYEERLRPLLAQLQTSIEQAMRGWAFEGGDPELVTVMTLGTYHWLGLQAQFAGERAPSSDMAPRFLKFVMRALELQTPLDDVGGAAASDPVADAWLDEEAWRLLEPLLPARNKSRRGGQWRDHREILRALEWRARTGCPWRELPEHLGPWQTAWRRWERWRRDGTWAAVVAAVEEARPELRRHCAWVFELEGPRRAE